VVQPEVAALMAKAEETGCLELSELNELVERMELTEEEVDRLYQDAQERDIEISDDCGREHDVPVYVNGDLPRRRLMRCSSSSTRQVSTSF